MSRFLFYLGHPAHYHNLKHSIQILERRGHQIKVVARGKDVLFDLIADEDWDVLRLQERKPSGKLGLIWSLAQRAWAMRAVVADFKPHLMAGTDLVIAHLGRLQGVPSLIVNEDDSAAIPLMAKYGFPYATAILAPDCCDQSPSNHKKIGYRGYHELAYLHPDLFQPEKARIPPELRNSYRYFILRFASLHAHHDTGKKGIDDALALRIIERLIPHGQVVITSERALSPELEPYRLHIHPREMHHVLAWASIYIGDSQTMAAEAAVLGVPALRFNDFVGKLSYLEELEHRYGLTRGISTQGESELFHCIDSWLGTPDLARQWQERRAFMLAESIAVTPFWVETFEALASPNR